MPFVCDAQSVPKTGPGVTTVFLVLKEVFASLTRQRGVVNRNSGVDEDVAIVKN